MTMKSCQQLSFTAFLDISLGRRDSVVTAIMKANITRAALPCPAGLREAESESEERRSTRTR
jgi:hypothetical protein